VTQLAPSGSMATHDVCLQRKPNPANRDCDMGFWYSRNEIIVLLVFLLLLVNSLSCLIPPFQSPDEFNHLKRAYLLSKGEVVLGSANGLTGGRIDTGLLDYMDYFHEIPFRYEKKITNPGAWSTREIAWSGRRQFSALPNTAAYLPLPYMPQALAFIVGEQTALSVGDTYYLARVLSLIATLGLLFAAFLVYPVPLIVVCHTDDVISARLREHGFRLIWNNGTSCLIVYERRGCEILFQIWHGYLAIRVFFHTGNNSGLFYCLNAVACCSMRDSALPYMLGFFCRFVSPLSRLDLPFSHNGEGESG
jgi:hypothetical protein